MAPPSASATVPSVSPTKTTTESMAEQQPAKKPLRTGKALWAKAAQLTAAGLDEHTRAHDAMGAMELLERMEAGVE